VLGVHDSDSNFPSRLDNKWWGASLIARFWFSDYELTSITAFDDFEHGRLVDFDGVETIQQHIDYSSDIDAWSQEFRLARDADKYNWIVGFNVAEDKFSEYSFLEGTSGLLTLAFGGLTQATQSYEQDTKMISGYGHAEYYLTDATGLIGEVRYTQEKKSFVGGVALNQVAPDAYISYTDDKKTFSDWSGKITLEHTLDNGNLLYGTISQGFKSGGFFGGFATSDAALAPFDNEKMTAYEVGFKSELLDQTLRINGAVFYYDRSDIQGSATDPTETVPVKRLQNIGDGRTWGGELEATWLASQYFRLYAGLGYLNTEITDSSLLVLDIYSSGTHSMEGARMPNTPSWSGNLVATYDRPISDTLSADISLEYSGRTHQDLTLVVLEEERPVLEEGGYSLFNIRANLRSLNGNWHVGVFVENLFDEDYRTVARSDTLGGIYELYGSPRVWGISLGTQF
jgi:iron complex outermembrane receptor protein